jgi:uncharacterized membrane protein YdbT with pleckstrin-like domain
MEPQQPQQMPKPAYSQPRPGRVPAGHTAPVTPEIEAKHQKSKRDFPMLRLSTGEYVIEEVNRHPIGIVSIWLFTGFILLVILAVMPMYAMNQEFIAKLFLVEVAQLPNPAILTVPVLILAAFVTLGGIIATIVYRGNRFYLTTESVIQHVQYSLFNTKQQIVNLINVEDASMTQNGIIEQVLNYGTLRLSTQGEETIYHFRFVAHPKKVVDDVNDAMEEAVRRLDAAPYPPSEL